MAGFHQESRPVSEVKCTFVRKGRDASEISIGLPRRCGESSMLRHSMEIRREDEAASSGQLDRKSLRQGANNKRILKPCSQVYEISAKGVAP